MHAFLEMVFSNAVLVTILAAVVFGVTRFYRRAALSYWLWTLVLLKLVTPPLVTVPLVGISTERVPAETIGAAETTQVIVPEVSQDTKADWADASVVNLPEVLDS